MSESSSRSDVPVARLALENVHKRFGATTALDGVDFDVRPGEVHALLGQNGSGKSTLVSVAYGQISPSSGRILVDGEACSFASPRMATRAGIALVAQEVPVVPELTVAENIMLGRLPRRAGRIAWRQAREEAAEALARLQSRIGIDKLMSELRPDERQLVTVARAMAAQARVVMFDEPTSSLSREQVDALFSTIALLKEAQAGVVFISQRLSEISSIADRVTVLRDGKVAGTLPVERATTDQITELMIGHSLTPRAPRAGVKTNSVALEVRDLSSPGAFRDVSFTLHAGEVVGIAGLVGSGRSELVRAIFGASGRTSGEVLVKGSPMPGRRTPAGSISAGLAFVTGERKAEGLVMSQTVHENLAVVSNRRLRPRLVKHRADRRRSRALIETFRVHPPHLDAPVLSLSGGNQQKVVLAKWMTARREVLLMDEPTRGVDIAAASGIYDFLREAADDGIAVLMSSADFKELIEVADRILVMFDGHVVADLTSGDTSENEVSRYATGTTV